MLSVINSIHFYEHNNNNNNDDDDDDDDDDDNNNDRFPKIQFPFFEALK